MKPATLEDASSKVVLNDLTACRVSAMDAENGIFMSKIELSKMKFGDVVYRQFNLDQISPYNIFSASTTGFNVLNDDDGCLVLRSWQPKSKVKEIKIQSLIVRQQELKQKNHDPHGEFREFTFFSNQLEALEAELEYFSSDLEHLTNLDYGYGELSKALLWKAEFLRSMIGLLQYANQCLDQSQSSQQSV